MFKILAGISLIVVSLILINQKYNSLLKDLPENQSIVKAFIRDIYRGPTGFYFILLILGILIILINMRLFLVSATYNQLLWHSYSLKSFVLA